MSLRLAVDFDADDWVGFSRRTDAANLWGSSTISAFRRQTVGAGSSSADGTAFSRYSADRAKYGKDRINWTMGNSTSAYINIGYNGTTYDNPSKPAGVYTAVLWARTDTVDPTSVFQIAITDATTTNYGYSSPAVTLTSSWQRFTVTCTVGSTDDLVIEFLRTVGNASYVVQITGVMLVAGAVGPEWFNSGSVSLLQDLTDYWGGGKWGLGFVRPYQYVAPVGKAELVLMNSDKRFSPEYSSGPLYGDLLPNLLVQIGDPDYGIWWTGWTDSWAPEPGTNRDKKAKLTATDARRFMAKKIPVLPLFDLETPNETIATIMDSFDVPNSTEGIPSGSEAIAWDALSPGITADLYADNVPYDHDAVKVMGDILGSLQGKFWFSRTGSWRYSESQGDDTPATYVDIAQNWLDLGYETGVIINKCEVIAHKRKSQSSGPYTVWESDDVPFAIDGLGTEVFRFFFKYDSTRKEVVGATGTFAITETNSGVAGDITAALSDIGAQSAVITFTNNNASSRNVTAASVSATIRVVQLREISKEYEDSASIAANGTLGERLDFQYTQYREWAKRLARYRVTRFKDARYEVSWVEMDADINPQDTFNCWIGAAVHVEDDQTGHDDYYAVVGEYHTVRAGLTDHTVKLHLEPLYPVSVADTSSA